MQAQEDRRVRRSRRLLGDALLALLADHDLSTIKVRQITERADVGYMTFYRHYDSIDDLLVDRVRTLIDEDIDQVIMACDRQGHLIFAHVQAYNDLYRTLAFSPGAAQARRKLEYALAESFVHTVIDDPYIPAELRARHMAASVLTLVQWWFETGMTTPIDQMAAMYDRLVIAGNTL